MVFGGLSLVQSFLVDLLIFLLINISIDCIMTVRRRYIQKTKKQGGVRRVTKSKIQKRRTMNKKGGAHRTRRMKRWGGMPKRRGPGGHAGPDDDVMDDDEMGNDVEEMTQALQGLTTTDMSRDKLILIIQVASFAISELLNAIPEVCKKIIITSSLLNVTGVTKQNYADTVLKLLFGYGIVYGNIALSSIIKTTTTTQKYIEDLKNGILTMSIKAFLERPIRNGMFFYLLFLNFGKYNAREAFEQTIKRFVPAVEVSSAVGQAGMDTIIPVLQNLKDSFDEHRPKAEYLADKIMTIIGKVAHAAATAQHMPVVTTLTDTTRSSASNYLKPIGTAINTIRLAMKTSIHALRRAFDTSDPPGFTATELASIDTRNKANFEQMEEKVKHTYQEYRNAVIALDTLLPEEITEENMPTAENIKQFIDLYSKVHFLSRKFAIARQRLHKLEHDTHSQMSEWSAQFEESRIDDHIKQLLDQYNTIKLQYPSLAKLSDIGEMEEAELASETMRQDTMAMVLREPPTETPEENTAMVMRDNIVVADIFSTMRAITVSNEIMGYIRSILGSVTEMDAIEGVRIAEITQTYLDIELGESLNNQLVVYRPDVEPSHVSDEEDDDDI